MYLTRIQSVDPEEGFPSSGSPCITQCKKIVHKLVISFGENDASSIPQQQK